MGDGQKPGLEGASGRVIFKARDAFGNRQDGFLDRLLRLLMGQTAFDGEAIDKFPVSVEKILPTLVVLPVFQAAQQALSGREQVFGAIVRFGAVYHRHIVACSYITNWQGTTWI